METITLAAVPPSARMAIFEALGKTFVYEELFPRLGKSPRQYGDFRNSCQELANMHFEMLRININITIE